MRIEDIQFFFINCKKDKFKYNLIISQWNECCKYFNQNIPIIRKDAVHFYDYSSPYYLESYQSQPSKIEGQISNFAVFKSHNNLWKHIIDNNIKYSLILEDDVIIPKTFLSDLQNILNDSNNQELLHSNWDILYFGILRMFAQKTYQYFHKIIPKKGYNNGLHSYLINLHSAKKLLKLTSSMGAINQIDILLRDNADDFNFYVYEKLLIKQDVENIESTRLGRFVKNELKQNFDEINIISN